MESLHGSIAQIASEVKQMSAQVANLAETNNKILTRMDAFEDRINALEETIKVGSGNHTKKLSGAVRPTVKKHPFLKVSYYSDSSVKND
jgi:septal ring factor EnvC (AmiA/AmiB activator)